MVTVSPTTAFTAPADRIGFATKAVLIGLFLGGGTVLRTGGSTIEHVAIGAVLASTVAAAIYFGLVALAAGLAESGRAGEPAGPRRRPVAADGRGDER